MVALFAVGGAVVLRAGGFGGGSTTDSAEPRTGVAGAPESARTAEAFAAQDATALEAAAAGADAAVVQEQAAAIGTKRPRKRPRRPPTEAPAAAEEGATGKRATEAAAGEAAATDPGRRQLGMGRHHPRRGG